MRFSGSAASGISQLARPGWAKVTSADASSAALNRSDITQVFNEFFGQCVVLRHLVSPFVDSDGVHGFTARDTVDCAVVQPQSCHGFLHQHNVAGRGGRWRALFIDSRFHISRSNCFWGDRKCKPLCGCISSPDMRSYAGDVLVCKFDRTWQRKCLNAGTL